MGDSNYSPIPRNNSGGPSANNKPLKKSSIAYVPKSFVNQPLKKMASLSNVKSGKITAGSVSLFLLKVAALETVRRVSRSKCPIIWSGLQALQVFCYPPFKWIQKWNPLAILVKGMQMLSRPILVLSIATAFSDHAESSSVPSDASRTTPNLTDSYLVSESCSDSSSVHSVRDNDEATQSASFPTWLHQLYEELKMRGITLPERLDEEELQRFYIAADGDFSRLVSSVRKTIDWRETYRILSVEELEMWSNFVFWHGVDAELQPCLIVRLGLACSCLPSNDRPRFAQAVVSQVEHGILYLVDGRNPHITVLVDCEGLSPMRLPMQMMRSCSRLLQDHFPNRLGCLFVIRLPSVVRVIAQTFIQVLKPVTRQKLKFEGKMYEQVVARSIQTLPSYLGGSCTCARCANSSTGMTSPSSIRNNIQTGSDTSSDDETLLSYPSQEADALVNDNCNQVIQKAVIFVLIFWAFVALLAGLTDPETRPSFPP